MVVTPVDKLQGCPSTSTAHRQAILSGGMKGSFLEVSVSFRVVETDQAEGQSVLDGGQARLLAAAACSGNTCVLLISPKTNLRNTFHTSRVNVHPPQ